MAGSTFYETGTVSVANGGTTVTGSGTAWASVVQAGDLFLVPAQGLVAMITAVASNTSITIDAWPGTTISGAAYKIVFSSDAIRQSERARQLLEQLSAIDANGRGLFYGFSTTTTDADPGAGVLRLNNATIASATAAYLDNLDANGATVSTILDTWDDTGSSAGRGQLWVRQIADPSIFHAWNVTGSVVDGTGYRKLTLAYIGGSGTLADGDELMVAFVPAGGQEEVSYVDGKEYLYPYHVKALAGSASTIILSGDSTTIGTGASGSYVPDTLVSKLGASRGIKSLTVTNAGHSGENTSDWDADHVINDMDDDPDVYIVRWGINDPAQGMTAADYNTALRSGLTKVRAHANGGLGECVVVVMMPNTIADTANGRDEAWLESIEAYARQAAADFNCVFFNTYRMFSDGTNGIGIWLDSSAVHPTNAFNFAIYDALAELLWPPSITAFSTTQFTNTSGGDETVNASDAPSTKNLGLYMARTGAGTWRADGAVFGFKQADGVTMEWIASYGTVTAINVRVADLGNDDWNGDPIPFVGPPVGLTAGSGFTAGSATPSATRTGNDVLLSGTFTQTLGALAALTTICTLPAGYRPALAYCGCAITVFNTATSFAEVLAGQVLADGTVRTLQAAASNVDYVFLDGISFRGG